MFVRVTSVVPTSRARENYSNQRACRVRFTPPTPPAGISALFLGLRSLV